MWRRSQPRMGMCIRLPLVSNSNSNSKRPMHRDTGVGISKERPQQQQSSLAHAEAIRITTIIVTSSLPVHPTGRWRGHGRRQKQALKTAKEKVQPDRTNGKLEAQHPSIKVVGFPAGACWLTHEE